jgi:cystathionine gamma-synthase
LDKKFGLNGRELLILSSDKAATALCNFAQIDQTQVIEYKNIIGVVLPEDKTKTEKAKAFRQHTGIGISTRWAEDILIEEGILQHLQSEEYFSGDAENHILDKFKDSYGAGSKDDIYLTSSGMNSVYSVYSSINALGSRNGKHIWIQFGWLFMDTIRILEKLRSTKTDNHVIYSVFNLEELELILSEKGELIAGIITEAPSNPLIQTPDIKQIKLLAEKHDCALVIDVTLGTPHNIDILPYADVVIESLTKYAAGSADLMMGSVILNSQSRFYEGLSAMMPNFLETPYFREIKRLAFQITGYAERMKKVNKNTMALVDFLQTRKSVKKIFWAYEEKSRPNFEKIQRAPDSPGGLITLELQMPLDSVYDRLKVAKGPSLGAEFTLVGPYLYHAHYDLVSTEEGRKFLQEKGLNPELLRISVGIEKIEDIIQVFSEVL